MQSSDVFRPASDKELSVSLTKLQKYAQQRNTRKRLMDVRG